MKGKIPYSVNYGENMGSNPAQINLNNGQISVNPNIWEDLTDEQRTIILTHELGHLENNSANEILADKYLIEKYGTSKEKLIEIIETINSFAPDTPTNRLRKIELNRNVLKQNQRVEDNKRVANLVWVPAAINAAATIFGSIAPTLFGSAQKSQWDKLSKEQKSVTVKEAIASAIYLIYENNNGSWSKVKEYASLPYSNPNSILSVAYSVLVQAGLFDGGNSATNSSPVTFWASYYSTQGLTPQYWLGQIELYKNNIVTIYHKQHPLKSTLSGNKPIYLIGIIALVIGAFFIIKQIRK